jgi:hypothetical protein
MWFRKKKMRFRRNLRNKKKLRILQEFLQKENLELSQFSQKQRIREHELNLDKIREHELNLDSRKNNFVSQMNNVFVKKNSQQKRISSRLIYRVVYINKWNSIILRLNFESMNRVCEHCDALHWISKRRYNISL